MTEFNKLVRDNLPEKISANGETPHVRLLEDDAEFLQALLQKDIEEGVELAEALNLEELADKLEVLYAIAKTLGYTPEELEQARADKAALRGGFEKRIYLESTD